MKKEDQRTSFRAQTSSSLSSRAVLRMRRKDARSVAAVWSDVWISCCTAWYGSVDIFKTVGYTHSKILCVEAQVEHERES